MQTAIKTHNGLTYIPINGICSNLSIAVAVGLAIVSLGPWFVWGRSFHVIFAALFMMLRLPLIKRHYSRRELWVLYSLVPFAFFYSKFVLDPLGQSLQRLLGLVMPIVFPILFSHAERQRFLRWLINTFSIMLLVSIIGFAIRTFIVELPHSEIIHPNPFYPPFKNYYFFTVLHDFGPLTRFTSMITEPGHVGMTAALLLFVNGYSWRKWQNVVMSIAMFWSMSLAGFVLFALGLFLYFILTRKSIIHGMIRVFIPLVAVISIGIIFYSPDNNDIVSLYILSRLTVDENKGISGNNRNTASFNREFDRFLESDDMLQGLSSEQLKEKFSGTANSSYKVFIMTYGMLSFLCLLLFMGVNLTSYPSKLGIGFTLLILASFVQRPYFLWEIQSFTYLCFLPLCHQAKLALKGAKQ